jgi:hypothetical protein
VTPAYRARPLSAAKGTAEVAELERGYFATAKSLLGGFEPAELTAFGTTLDSILSRLRAPSQADEPMAS